MNIFFNDSVAGGWTEHDSVARRICTALWERTEAFTKIKRYHADVVIDYEIVLREVAKLEPGQAFLFTYYVHADGTHFAVLGPAEDVAAANAAYCSHVASIADSFFPRLDDAEQNMFYTGYVRRSEYSYDEKYGTRWGADKYAMSIDSFVARKDHVEITSPATALPIPVVVQQD